MQQQAGKSFDDSSRLSTAALILANAIPVAGVIWFDWLLFDVLIIYWAESAVIGFWNLARMYVIGGPRAVPMGLFFCVHYGIFMAVHLIFIHVIFGDDPFVGGSPRGLFADFPNLALPLLALLASHGIAFFQNFIGQREWVGLQIEDQMFAPYSRIIAMHVTLFGGGFVIDFFGATTGMVVVLILIKIGIDWFIHLRS